MSIISIPNMGKQQSKNSEVIIAQNGANDATNAMLEKKVEMYSIFTVFVIIILLTVIIFLGIKFCGRRVRNVLVKDIVSSMEKGQIPQVQTRPVIQQIPVQVPSQTYQ